MKQETSLYEGRATILDQNSKQLSIGRAFFDISGVSGRYEPTVPFQNTPGSQPAFLVLLPETENKYRLGEFEPQCQATGTVPYPHHHFDIEA